MDDNVARVLGAVIVGLLSALIREERGVRRGVKNRRPRQPWTGGDDADDGGDGNGRHSLAATPSGTANSRHQI